MVLAKCRGMGNEPTYVSTKLMNLIWDYIKGPLEACLVLLGMEKTTRKYLKT